MNKSIEENTTCFERELLLWLCKVINQMKYLNFRVLSQKSKMAGSESDPSREGMGSDSEERRRRKKKKLKRKSRKRSSSRDRRSGTRERRSRTRERRRSEDRGGR